MIYRGAQVGPEVTTVQLQELQEAGANLIRYQIAPWENEDFETWLDSVTDGAIQLAYLARNLPDLSFVADLHRAPKNSTFQDIKSAWRSINFYLKDCSNIITYGILNEPPVNRTRCEVIMKQVAADIRSYRPQQRLSLTYPYSDPPHFLEARPYGVHDVWYEVHMYLPLRLTHQGVYPQFPTGVTYPRPRLNKEKLRQLLQPVRSFQQVAGTHKRKIFVGEFGCSTFTDPVSRLAYLSDLLELLDEYQWHWTYHAIFEAEVWKPDDAIMNLLKKYWRKNG